MRLRDVLPFSPEAFIALFADYNQAIWPWQLVAYALGLIAILLVLRPAAFGGRIVGGILATLWLWTGVVFHLVFFDRINLFAPIFALLFVVQGLMLLWTAGLRGRVEFAFERDLFGWTGLGFAVFALVVYPLLALALGVPAASTPHFGTTPCPLAIFTFGLLLLVRGRTPIHLIVIPLLWSLIGGTAAFLLEMPQDYALPAAGLAGLIFILWKNRARKG